jgi:hypothetical protein
LRTGTGKFSITHSHLGVVRTPRPTSRRYPEITFGNHPGADSVSRDRTKLTEKAATRNALQTDRDRLEVFSREKAAAPRHRSGHANG